MAVIALKGVALDYTVGLSAIDNLNTAFTNTIRSTNSLRNALSSLKHKTDIVATFASIETSRDQIQKAEERETQKTSALTLAYNKLDNLISDIGLIDQKVFDFISRHEDDFYKQYYYLKPESKKSTGEKISDAFSEGWKNFTNFLGGLGEAIVNAVRDVCEWCIEHWESIVSIIAAIGIAVAVIVLSVATFGATAVLLAAVVGACVGVIGQLGSDIVAWALTGEWSGTLQSYIGAIFGGAVGGVLVLSGNYALASAAEAGLSTFFGQHLENLTGGEQRSSLEILFNTTLNASLAAGFSKGFDKLSSNFSKYLSKNFKIFRRLAGPGNYDAAFRMVLTKLSNGQIRNFTINTFRNGIMGGLSGSFFENIFNGIIDGMVTKYAE